MANGIFSNQQLKELVQRYIQKLYSMTIPVTKVYIYGSYAQNKADSDSDIDICVISPTFQDRIDATMTLMKIRDEKELLISPIAFSPENFTDENALAWEIKRTGILV